MDVVKAGFYTLRKLRKAKETDSFLTPRESNLKHLHNYKDNSIKAEKMDF